MNSGPIDGIIKQDTNPFTKRVVLHKKGSKMEPQLILKVEMKISWEIANG